MIAGLLSGFLLLLRPEAGAAEALLAAGLLAAVLVVAAVPRALRTTEASAPVAVHGFAALRVLLRASDPDAAGHHRARAPGATR